MSRHIARMRRHLSARPRLAGALATGTAAALLLPDSYSVVTRALLGWNIAVWLYLVLVLGMMLRADHARLRRIALAQAEGAATVLTIVIVACVVSLLGMVAELTAAKLPGARHALPHLAFALATVAGAWLLLPTVFTLTYASLYYRSAQGAGRGAAVSGCRRRLQARLCRFPVFLVHGRGGRADGRRERVDFGDAAPGALGNR